jgi:hypothetical protein
MPYGFELGVGLGYAWPAGNLYNGSSLGDSVSNAVPLTLDLGGRFDKFTLSASFTYAVASPREPTGSYCKLSGASCSADIELIEVKLARHFRPASTVDPWLAVAFGYEILSAKEKAQVSGFSIDESGTYNGPEYLNFQFGVDFRPVPHLGFGPLLGLSMAEYSNCSISGSSTCTVHDASIHEWITLGVRAIYDSGSR